MSLTITVAPGLSHAPTFREIEVGQLFKFVYMLDEVCLKTGPSSYTNLTTAHHEKPTTQAYFKVILLKGNLTVELM